MPVCTERVFHPLSLMLMCGSASLLGKNGDGITTQLLLSCTHCPFLTLCCLPADALHALAHKLSLSCHVHSSHRKVLHGLCSDINMALSQTACIMDTQIHVTNPSTW